MSDAQEAAVPFAQPVFPQMTGQATADTLGFSRRWLSKLVDDGYCERKENGLFDLGDVAKGYVRFLEEARARKADGQESRLRELQREKLQLEVAKLRNSLIDVAEAERTAAEIIVVLRSELLKVGPLVEDPILGAKVTRGLEETFCRAESRMADFFSQYRAGAPDLTELDDPEE